jgi:arabinose-5-phosphate isomerase
LRALILRPASDILNAISPASRADFRQGATPAHGRETILNRAREIIDDERQALDLTMRAIDQRFVRAVELLERCKGKVVLTGMGKSGLVAQKIAATLSSTGTTAVFMHAAEGVHGDLGVINRRDLVVALSYSGTTLEILSLLPTIERVGAKVIAMVGDLKSPLAERADAVLPVVIHREAGWLNLAPTSSTAAMMALGDALALVLSEKRGFRPEDFALFHPGGNLGRRLLLRVRDLMHSGEDNPLALPTTPMAEITDILTRTRLGGVSVVKDRRSRVLAGIITDGDIRSALSRREEFFNLLARDVMTPNPVSIHADLLAADALNLMENRKSQISVLPVVDDRNRVVGLVRVHDLLQLNRR